MVLGMIIIIMGLVDAHTQIESVNSALLHQHSVIVAEELGGTGLGPRATVL